MAQRGCQIPQEIKTFHTVYDNIESDKYLTGCYMVKTNSSSVSRFLVPFYNEKKDYLPFKETDFTRYQVKTRYLVESVYELFKENKDTECKCYYLNSELWGSYGLPPRFSNISLRSEMSGCSDIFDIAISAIRVYYFKTGIGFLEIEIQYPADDIDAISDVSFCLSNIFTNEHDSGDQENRLFFSYISDNTSVQFSLKNSIFNILNVATYNDDLKLFPANSRKKLLSYHSVITPPQEDIKKYIYALCNGLHSNVFYDEEMDDNTGFSSISNQMWGISSTGVASVAYPSDKSRKFVETTFKRNTIYDYYYIFLLVAHEREILLKYNHEAVKNRANPKALVSMKKDLLKLRVIYTYNTVSTESSYQRFYECISDEFNISSLEADIRDVVEAVDCHVNDIKDRKMNTILAALSLLAIFSILTDGIALADRIESGSYFGVLQWGVIGIVAVIITIVLFGQKRG